MAKFWALLAKYATKVALYAVDHPDQIIALINQAKAAKG